MTSSKTWLSLSLTACLMAASSVSAQVSAEAANTLANKAIKDLLASTTKLDSVRDFDFENSELEDFLKQPQDMRQSSGDVRSLTVDDQAGCGKPALTTCFQQSDSSEPSRLVLLGTSFFSLNYYYRTLDSGHISGTGWRRLFNQPWLEYLPDTRTYVLRASGAERKLFDLLTGNTLEIELFRGTRSEEATLISFISALNSQNANRIRAAAANLRTEVRITSELYRFLDPTLFLESAIDEKTKSAFFIALSHDLEETWGSGGLFVTPSKGKAKEFVKANGVVISYKIPVAKLRQLIDRQKLYVGIESQIELNFLGPEGLSVLLTHAVRVDKVDSHTNSLVGATSHPLWK